MPDAVNDTHNRSYAGNFTANKLSATGRSKTHIATTPAPKIGKTII